MHCLDYLMPVLAEVMYCLSALWVKPWLSYSSACLSFIVYVVYAWLVEVSKFPDCLVERVHVALVVVVFLVCKLSYSLPHSAVMCLRGARFQHSPPCNIPRHNRPSLHATKARSPCSELNPQIFKPLYIRTLRLLYLHLIDWISISIKKKMKILNGEIRAGWHLSQLFVMKLSKLIKFLTVHVVIINFNRCKIPPQ